MSSGGGDAVSADASAAGGDAASGGGAVTQPVGSRLQPDAAAKLMPPPAPRHHRAAKRQAHGPAGGGIVLEEDEWTARLDRIITRDYFPDVPKLKNKLEWLEATRSGDPEVIRQAQMNIQRRQREALGTPGGLLDTPSLGGSTGTGGTGTTPSPSVHRGARRSEPATPSSVAGSEYGDGEHDDVSLAAAAAAAADARLSLDGFLNKYTSEDNASFNEILDRHNAAKRARYSWCQQKTFDDKHARDAASLAAAHPSKALPQGQGGEPGGGGGGGGDKAVALVTDGSGTADGASAPLAFHKYRAKNELYYNVDGVALSVKELERCVQGPPKETVSRNTRFVMSDASRRSQAEPAGAAGSSGGGGGSGAAARVVREMAGIMGGAGVGGDGAAQTGYGMVATPSPAPGVDDSPFMTWGDIQGTPLRLDMEETPVDIGGWGGGAGVSGRFHISHPRARDDVLRRMTTSAHPGAAPSPSRGGVRTPGTGTGTGIGTGSRTGAGGGSSPAGVTRTPSRATGTPGRRTPGRTPLSGGSGGGAPLSDAAKSLLRRMHGTPDSGSTPQRSGALGGGGLNQALRGTYSGRNTPSRGGGTPGTGTRGTPGTGTRGTPLSTPSRLSGGRAVRDVPPPPPMPTLGGKQGGGKNITDDLLNI